jgi:hypothetical protein
MTEPPDEQPEHRPTRIVVPGRAAPPDDLPDDELIPEEQQVRDLGSASRSCVAILATLLILALLVCVFLTWAFFIK